MVSRKTLKLEFFATREEICSEVIPRLAGHDIVCYSEELDHLVRIGSDECLLSDFRRCYLGRPGVEISAPMGDPAEPGLVAVGLPEAFNTAVLYSTVVDAINVWIDGDGRMLENNEPLRLFKLVKATVDDCLVGTVDVYQVDQPQSSFPTAVGITVGARRLWESGVRLGQRGVELTAFRPSSHDPA